VRLVLDTNTALSGLLWGGTPGRLIDAAQERTIELACSAALLAELEGILRREKFTKPLARRAIAAADIFNGYAALVRLVTPANIAPTIERDPSDDQVLAAALAARADLIVSGDAHLLDLKNFQAIPIVTARQALERIATP